VKFGIVRFPGSCDEVDAALACRRFGDAELLWHADRDLRAADAIVIPGGFSYGDYLRAGAIARFSPVMEAVTEFAADGGPVLGICNGFQVLCEAGLLPGALLSNTSLRFVHAPADDLDRLEADGRVVLRYAPGQNPNGAERDIAGVLNEAGNVMGLMPHPEHAVDPLTGSTDGGRIFASLAAAEPVPA